MQDGSLGARIHHPHAALSYIHPPFFPFFRAWQARRARDAPVILRAPGSPGVLALPWEKRHVPVIPHGRAAPFCWLPRGRNDPACPRA